MAEKAELQIDCKERVAYDLMKWIASDETSATKDRNYWLQLYRQCYKATNGLALDQIKRTDQ